MEAMNNAGKSKTKLIVIFNDNNMSISNVGALAKYFAKVRSNPRYFRLKAAQRKLLTTSLRRCKISNAIFRLKTKIKNLIYNSTIFEDLGFRYMGRFTVMIYPPLLMHLKVQKLQIFPLCFILKRLKAKVIL